MTARSVRRIGFAVVLSLLAPGTARAPAVANMPEAVLTRIEVGGAAAGAK